MGIRLVINVYLTYACKVHSILHSDWAQQNNVFDIAVDLLLSSHKSWHGRFKP